MVSHDAGVLAELPGISSGQKGFVAILAVVAVLALAYAYVLVREVLKADQGTESMQSISKAVQEGAAAYLNRQFRTLGVFAVIVFVLLLLLPVNEGGASVRIGRAVFFLIGAAFSATVGYIGMTMATRANVRVAAAARGGRAERGFHIAFRTGGIVGMLTVGLGLLGASIVLLTYNNHAPTVLEGFGFGGALLAMFMRVGGGIFTKAADVGADLVGKVEAGIPEDDPRNAATIADNVGDNVGDCAGMAADLFESYAVTLVAALILGQTAFGAKGLLLPLIIGGIGIISSVVGILTTKLRDSDRNGLVPINRGFFISAATSLVLVAILAFTYLPSKFSGFGDAIDATGNPKVIAFVAVLIGIVLAVIIQQLTGYFTDTIRRPVKDVADTSRTGPATVILSGIALGLESAVYTAVLIALAVFGAFLLGSGSVGVSLFAVALAGTGLLTTAGVIVSMDTFGPVSDNAQGVAEMSGDIDETGARVLTDLDAVGNTTKAITKGIAIATAVLAATALFGSFTDAIAIAITKYNGNDVELPDRVAERAGRRDHRRLRGVPVQRPGDQRGRPRRRTGRVRGAQPVPQPPRDHGLHREARLRGRGRHLHQGLAARAGDAGPAGDLRADHDRLRLRRRPAGRLPRRRDRGRRADGGVPRQLRWRVGQREEDGRGRPARRQGQRGARRDRHR